MTLTSCPNAAPLIVKAEISPVIHYMLSSIVPEFAAVAFTIRILPLIVLDEVKKVYPVD